MPYLGIVYKKFLGSLTPCNILIHPLFSAHEGHTQIDYPFMYANRTVQCIVLYNAGVYRSSTVNSKSFVGKVLLRIKRKFELTVYFKHGILGKL